jgi:DNA-binding response OmpR family regulator
VKREVTRGDKRIELTSKEFALLEFLLRRRDQVLSRAVIAQHVWGVNYDTFTNVIDVYVNYLRKKIDSGFEPKLIHTVRGAGYVLKEEP